VTQQYLVDSNVLIRFLVRDEATQSEGARRLFRRAEAGECELNITPWIAAEVVYALSSVYRFDRKRITLVLREMCTEVGITVADKEVVLDALARFAAKTVDFADALIAAQSSALKIPPASFDRDLDKFPDIKRHTPQVVQRQSWYHRKWRPLFLRP
jgi:predicted nucleic-acid-binding protein